MLPRHRSAIPLVVFLSALVLGLAACGSGSGSGSAAAEPAGRLTIVDARVDTPIGGQTAIRMIVHNGTGQADSLLSVSSPIAARSSIHRTIDKGSISTMVAVARLAIPARSDVTFEPGGLHVMLTGVTGHHALGTHVPVTLTFAHAGRVTVSAVIVRPGADPDMEHMHD